MKVTACLVTRGDVDLEPILESLPEAWEVIVWDNSAGLYWARDPVLNQRPPYERVAVSDLGVYGRYAAIEYAAHDLIYVQDDDVIVSDPQAIVAAWKDSRAKCAEEQFDPKLLWHASSEEIKAVGRGEHICCNMPKEFRHAFYQEHALVGFGAVFHRDAPEEAFSTFHTAVTEGRIPAADTDVFERTCDIVFTALTPRVLVDVPKTNLPYAEDESRMYRQPEHQAERSWTLEQTLKVKEAS